MSKVAIIGAGPCGLSMLRAFQQAQAKGETIPKIVCYEKQDDWGGLWNYSWRTGTDQYGDTVHNSMYRYLWSNAPKECQEFADYSFDEHFGKPIGSYPPRAVLYDYLIGRAKKSNLREHIRFNTTALSVTYSKDGFKLVLLDKKENKQYTEVSDYVIVATGHFSVPNVPAYPGMDTFPGRILHAHDFRSADEFKNQDLIILGSSYSAEDIALQCYKYGAKSITIGYRHNPLGFKWPGGIKEVHYLDKLEGKTAHFKDGNTQEADSIILCTGYLHYFPFMEDMLKLVTSNRLYCPDLYKGVVWHKNPKLFYLGMQNQFYTFSMFDTQCWFARDVILGKISIPSEEEMQKDITSWISSEEKLENIFQLIDFQTAYVKDLCSLSDYPKLNLDKVCQNFNVWEHNKREDILTYRDTPFSSAVTGTEALTHKTTWVNALDDSMETFLN